MRTFTIYKSERALLEDAKKLEGLRISDISKMIGELDIQHRKHTKNVIADIIENRYFGLPKTSSSLPDFKDLGIELKVSPLKYVASKDLINAKERNVIGMVDYQDVYNTPRWQDNERLACKLDRVLFIFYIHDNSVPAFDWQVVSAFLWSPNGEESELIQKDYEIIRSKVLAGERNSEGHNIFLATCPKHAGGFIKENPAASRDTALAKHPVMGIAERRGYCLRNNPVTGLVAKYGLGVEPVKKGTTFGIRPKDFRGIL